MREKLLVINNKMRIIKLLSLVILIIYFKHSFSQIAAWREDEAVTLWLALVNNLFDSPFGNVSSKGIPNPNLSIVISKFLIIFDSLTAVSFFIGIFQMFVIYYAFYSNKYEYNIVLILFIGFSLYFTYLTTSIWYQFMITTLNAIFLKLIFDYIFEKKYYLFWYFPLLAMLPASLYLGGLSNSVLFSLFFATAVIFNLRNFKSNFLNFKHFFIPITLLVSLSYITWYQYFSNLDFGLLRIQSGSQLFPYSRIRDYVYVGIQYIKETPQFFMDIFSSTDSIYFLFTYSDKLTEKTSQLIDLTLIAHKVLNAISVLILFGSLTLLFTSFKEKINNVLVYKNLFVLIYIFSFTIITPLLGGRQFLQFDIMALSVFASIYICFIFIWVSLPFIFKELKLLNFILKAILYAFIFLNILTSFYLRSDYLNTQSSFLSEADESLIYKQEIVDFIATKTDKEVSIYYDLGGGIYDWIPEFNDKNYSTGYYLNSFSLGRDFDYLFKKKFNIDNSQEGNLYRVFQDTDFYISYIFEEFPNNIYNNYKHYQFGNFRVTENLGKS
jgi:hypothetical protein